MSSVGTVRPDAGGRNPITLEDISLEKKKRGNYKNQHTTLPGGSEPGLFFGSGFWISVNAANPKRPLLALPW